MKICIWCKRNNSETNFYKIAHTIPQSLGGKQICKNVCDECNHYFGANHNDGPPIETIIKETFNISRTRFLMTEGQVGKNRTLPRFTSTYFNVDLKKSKLSLKPSYKLQRGFQEKVGRQMKRGLYKIYLEENERQFGNSSDPRFDFIREFARYNIGDHPVFYFERLNGIIAMSMDWVRSPELLLGSKKQMKYIIQHPSFVEFEFLGHALSLATSRNWHIILDDYIRKTKLAKRSFFSRIKPVINFNDIDLSLSILNNKKGY